LIIGLLACCLWTPICNNYKNASVQKHCTMRFYLEVEAAVWGKWPHSYLCSFITSKRDPGVHFFHYNSWTFSIHLSNLVCQVQHVSALLRAKRLVLFAYIHTCLLPPLWPWCLSSVLLDITLAWLLDLGTPTNSTSGLHFQSVSDHGHITLESCSGVVGEYFIRFVFLFYSTTPCRFHLLHSCFVS
jgi:hypothetical protein